jgi:3-hydroxybutyryl-CoA dehydratase
MQARPESIKPGAIFVKERTFTREDVEAFTLVSRDRGVHHLEPDGQGRLMTQGLLTATVGTEIGGELDFLASEMTFRFLRPVFTGDTVRCEVRVDSVREEPGRQALELSFVMRNQNGKDVLSGDIRGVIRR